MAVPVSVIVPFYGTSQSRGLELVAESILSQKGVDIDFVVAGLQATTRVKNRFDLSRHPKESVLEIVRTGAVLNNGLRLATGDFVYITDADILLPNQHYLEGLVQESLFTGTSLKRPIMRRLLIQDFDWFYSMVFSKGLENSITSLDTSQKYVVKPTGVERPMRVFPKFENERQKVFIASEKDFQDYISDERNKGSEPRFFNQDRHCGTTFASTDMLRDVGGYCEEFISWGVWDADVQWKLESIGGMGLIPKSKDFEVIHLDHPREYFDKEKWDKDKGLQKIRRSQGYELSVKQDRLVYFGGKNGR